MQSGENFTEACQREVLEETGLQVQVKRLIGIFTSPNTLLEYADGNKWQLVVLHFEAEFVRGQLTPSEETIEFGFFSLPEIVDLNMSSLDRKRVLDGLEIAIIHDDFSL
jgi:ADP-ribose pyrophosphatase YjhB (NUDIX family)